MQIKRIAAVTAGLGAAGAVAGSIVGLGFVAGVLMLNVLEPAFHWNYNVLLGIVFLTMVGAVAGALLGPVAAWLLMRHVPLGRAIAGTTLGALAATLAGVGLGIVTGIGDNGFLVYPLLGFGASSVYLSVRTPREARRIGAWSGRALPPV